MDKEVLISCYNRILPFIHRTPVLKSRLLNELTGAELYFKCENFQRMGAFKMRGAVNAILQLPEKQKTRGVVTHSSGNFGQALALAGQSLGVKSYVVMPSDTPQVKKNAVKDYGAEIIECAPNIPARENAAKKIADEKGATFIHPSNDINVIIGQGTACMELLQDQPDLEFVFSPVGGGGLIAGTALAAHFFGSNCRVIGGEPEAADDASRSLRTGKIEGNKSAYTIADGLKTQLGDKNFPIIKQYVDSIITVSENEIIEAMRLIWERMKMIVEPSSAVAFAAVLKQKEKFHNKKTGVIISGGNVDLSKLPF